jgi:hypothetical protein
MKPIDWEQYRKEVEERELVNDASAELCDLSYTGQWSGIDHVLSNGIRLNHGILWEFTTRYKYMSKLSNIKDYYGNCLVGYGATKMERCLELGCDWGH